VGRALPPALAFALLPILGLAGWAAVNLNTSDSPARLFEAGHSYRKALAYLSESRGWLAEMSLTFPKGKLDSMTAVLGELENTPNVVRVIDPRAVVRYMTGGLTRPGAFETRFSDDGASRASLYLADVGLDSLNQTLVHIQQACKEIGCRPAGDLVTYVEFSNRVPAALLRSLALCLLLVSAVLGILTRVTGQRYSMRIIVAAVWGPAVMLVVVWLWQVPVNVLMCVFASVLVGLTGDNAIQYLFAGPGQITRGINKRGGASVQIAMVMGLVCLFFLGSSFVPSQRMGLLLALGFITSLCGDVWIMRGLLSGKQPHVTPELGYTE
jgi:hypothetical protein